MFKCSLCENEYDSILSLCTHWCRTHKCSSESLYKILNNIPEDETHLCECGCGTPTKYIEIVNGYRRYIRGHAARVNNNWGNNPKAILNSYNKRKKMIEDGTWKPFHLIETGEHWCKGLTAETDERILKMKNTINEPKNKQAAAERMRERRLNGICPTQYGPDSSQWKGGVSVLSNAVGSNKDLYKLWKYPKLCAAGFKCQKCDENKNLQVHHDVELWSEIIRKVATQYNWYELTKGIEIIDNPELYELKQQISNAVVEYHVNNNVSGKVLCKRCHKDEHASYNFVKDDDD
jgi:hypothetical protein